jgi:hypothetical protein
LSFAQIEGNVLNGGDAAEPLGDARNGQLNRSADRFRARIQRTHAS